MSSAPVLELQGVTKAYGETPVLTGVDLAVREHKAIALIGASGSGKSTLGRLLSGINAPRTGSAAVGGVELTALPLDVLRTEVALVTQECSASSSP